MNQLQDASLNGNQWISETCALGVVAIASVFTIWALCVVSVVNSPWGVGLIAVPSMLAIALYAWHGHEKTKTADAEQWKMGTIFTPFLGAVFFAIDIFVGSSHGHYDNLFQAGFHAGSPFGILTTVLVCPIGTIVCMGGWVRCSIIERLNPQPED